MTYIGPGQQLRFRAGLGGDTYTQKVQALSPIAYWPMGESSGSVSSDESGNSRDGAYSNVTLAQTGIGDGRTAASFNGTSSYNNIYTAGLAGAFNGDEGSFNFWIKVSGSGVWTDATGRTIAVFQNNANNRVIIDRTTVNNTIRLRQVAGATTKIVSFTSSSVDWLAVGMTWSKAADQMIAYLGGAQTGTTQTGLGTFVGPLTNTVVVLGATSVTPTLVWSGFLAHAAVWATPLSAGQMATLATL